MVATGAQQGYAPQSVRQAETSALTDPRARALTSVDLRIVPASSGSVLAVWVPAIKEISRASALYYASTIWAGQEELLGEDEIDEMPASSA